MFEADAFVKLLHRLMDLATDDLYDAVIIDAGTDAYNQALSERRAQAVADYLVARGVHRARIATQGYGETRLLVNPERSEADRQANRRVEIRIVPATTGG